MSRPKAPRPARRHDTIERLRQVFRGLPLMLSHYEMTGLDEFVDVHGTTWNVHDVLAWYRLSQRALSPRQAQAIRLCLVLGMREQDAAVTMGLAPTNPVAMYATDGLRRLCDRTDFGWAA